jgi:hypothetical protein
VGSVAADATGLVASGVLAGLGLWILPRKRRQAKERFLAHSEELRSRLLLAMREEFDRELQRSMQRIKDALAPYDRFVRTEHESATRLLHHLQAVLDELRTLRARLDAAQPSVV